MLGVYRQFYDDIIAVYFYKIENLINYVISIIVVKLAYVTIFIFKMQYYLLILIISSMKIKMKYMHFDDLLDIY